MLIRFATTLAVVMLLIPALRAQRVAEVFGALDAGKTASLRTMSPDALYKTLKKGRPVGKFETGESKRPLPDAFGRETDIWVNVPRKPRGIIFVLHGLGGSGRQLKDRLFRRFAAKEGLVIAAPSAQKEPREAPNEDSSGTTRRFPHWWSYRDGNFVLSALSMLKKQLPIDENRVYLCGYSMGGFGTWNIGLRFSDRFAALAPMAGGISRAEYVTRLGPSDLRGLLYNAKHAPLYFIHGARDRTVPARFDRDSAKELEKLGYDHEYVEVKDGGHLLNVREGSKLMNPLQKWFRARKRDAHPKTVHHHAVAEDMPQSHWIRIEAFAKTPARVTASIEQGNRIAIKTEGVKRLTVYVDETHLDLKKPLTIKLNGKQVLKKRLTPSAACILESWAHREDRQLLYRAKATLDVQ